MVLQCWWGSSPRPMADGQRSALLLVVPWQRWCPAASLQHQLQAPLLPLGLRAPGPW